MYVWTVPQSQPNCWIHWPTDKYLEGFGGKQYTTWSYNKSLMTPHFNVNMCACSNLKSALGFSKQAESGAVSREFKLKCIWRHQLIGLWTSIAAENSSCVLCLHLGGESHPGSVPLHHYLWCDGGLGPHRSELMVFAWEDFWEKEITLI